MVDKIGIFPVPTFVKTMILVIRCITMLTLGPQFEKQSMMRVVLIESVKSVVYENNIFLGQK